MKKKLLIITLGFLLVGVNAFAAGDLQVNGSLGIGSTPSTDYKSVIVGNNVRAISANTTVDQDGVVLANGAIGIITKSDISGTSTGFATGISLISTVSSTASNISGALGASFITSLSNDTNGSSTVAATMAGKFETVFNPGARDYTVTQGYGFNLILRDYRWSGNGTLHYDDFKNININDAANDYSALSVDNLSGIWLEKQTLGTSNYGIVLNGYGSSGDYGAAVVFGPSQNVRLYAKSDGKLYAHDGTNETVISPHDPETEEWIYFSKNVKTGKTVRVNMEKLVKAVEELTGEKFMIESYEEK